MIRKINNNLAFGITSPLITNPDGTKMGKTAAGAIWLDKKKFSKIRKNIIKIIKKINWKDGFFRKDIGWRVI